jgi:hypothetical protein
MNAETDSLRVSIGNADGAITEIYGSVDVELAQLTLHRYFPDIDEALTMWVGYGGAMDLDEYSAEWDVHFGLRGFTHKGLRKVSGNCWKIFKDGVYCPYDGSSIGEASDLNGAIDNVTTTVVVTNGVFYYAGDIILVESEQMLVNSVSTHTLTVDRGYDGTTPAAHADAIPVYHHSCHKSKESCNRRRMFGPPDKSAGLRYFGGWSEVSPIYFQGGGGRRGLLGRKEPVYSQSSHGNVGVFGSTVPVVYGTYRLVSVEAAAAADAREFKHALFILCEGEITSIASNLTRVQNTAPDNIPNQNESSFNVVTMDSFHVWYGGIGQRQSKAIMSNIQDANTDTYLSHPYLFNQSNGDGLSLSDVAAVRIRVEEEGNEFDDNYPSGDFQIIGRKCRTIQSYIDDNPALLTSFPDPIVVACDYLVNGKFGARLDEDRLDETSANTESTYCKANVTPVASTVPDMPGTILAGPDDSGYGIQNPTYNWVAVEFTGGEEPLDGALAGRTLKITEVGKEASYTIIHNYRTDRLDPTVYNNENVMGFVDDTDLGETGDFYILEISGTWTALKIPADGDTFTITKFGVDDTVDRFRFNGALTDDDPVEKQLALILQNCAGYYFPRGDSIVFGIRKSVTLATIDALTHLKDYGTDRNILRFNGVSSLKINRNSLADGIANQIDVVFYDAENGFQETTIHVYDESLQQLTGEVVSGDETRVVHAKSIRLIGTTSADQAMRLGALYLREEAMKRDTCSFSMSLKDSLALEPGDIRKLDSVDVNGDVNKQLSQRIPYVRITKIEETDKFTALIEGHRHENGAYDDTFTHLVDVHQRSSEENPLNFPKQVIPIAPVETVTYSKDGVTQSVITVGVTYP